MLYEASVVAMTDSTENNIFKMLDTSIKRLQEYLSLKHFGERHRQELSEVG